MIPSVICKNYLGLVGQVQTFEYLVYNLYLEVLNELKTRIILLLKSGKRRYCYKYKPGLPPISS